MGWSCTLAVMPNDPHLIHLSKNRNALLLKRNRLLISMSESGILDKANLELYLEEPLPDRPFDMPNIAPHLLASMKKEIGRDYLKTSCDIQMQKNYLSWNKYLIAYSPIRSTNAAILVAEINTGNIIAYVGNIEGTGQDHGEQVDIIQSNRSTGSLLKPFLAMLAIQEGRVTTRTTCWPIFPLISMNLNLTILLMIMKVVYL